MYNVCRNVGVFHTSIISTRFLITHSIGGAVILHEEARVPQGRIPSCSICHSDHLIKGVRVSTWANEELPGKTTEEHQEEQESADKPANKNFEFFMKEASK